MDITGLLGLLPGLLALAGLCAFLTRRGLPASLAPLAGLALVELALLCGGMLGALKPAVILVYAGGFLLGAAALKKNAAAHMGAPRGASLFAGCLFFWGLAAALSVFLAVLQPEFLNFDEYSFWGTATKMTVVTDTLYTVAPSALPWQMTEFAAVPLTAYFFQAFGAFAAWKTIFSCDVLLLAGLSAVLGCARGAGRRVAGPLAVVLALLPSVLSLTGHTSYYIPTWLEALGDLPAGVLFGAAAAFWFLLRRGPRSLWWLELPVLCLAANIKNNTFVLALAAAGIVAADAVLFFEKTPKTRACAPEAEPLWQRLAFGAAALAAPMAQYAVWNRYCYALVMKKSAAGGYGTTSQPLPEVLKNSVIMLFGGTAGEYYEARRETFFAYRTALRQLFFSRRISLFGPGAALVAVILLVFAAAILLFPTARQKLRAAVCAMCSAVCFLLYWLMLLFSYAFILKDSGPAEPASYARYFTSYYIGWLALALAVLGLALSAALAQNRKRLCARGTALALAAVFAGLTLAAVEPQFVAVGATGAYYADAALVQRTAREVEALLPEGSTLFLVQQGDDGFAWFSYCEAFYPVPLVYGAGGGTYGLAEYFVDNSYYQERSLEDFDAMLRNAEVDYILLTKVDETFVKSYAPLFTDGLAGAENGSVWIYRVTAAGFEPFDAAAQEAAG